ncbi:MAG: copper resistance protein CopC [Methylococcales bacterium]|nr:copper resistance protein CopC [Methylococcales bacterium]
MKKLLLFSLLLLLECQAPLVCAHAVVTDYSLKVTPLHTNHESKVELSFNSKVELGLSQLFLVSKGDKHQLLPAVNGEKQGQIIVTVPPLAVGDYAIRLKVFAADGHLTEDVIHFTATP